MLQPWLEREGRRSGHFRPVSFTLVSGNLIGRLLLKAVLGMWREGTLGIASVDLPKNKLMLY